jgi:iron complex outermembrane receptor protein
MGNQVGNLPNQDFIIPESTVLDAAINYEIDRVNFQLNISNLTNKRYFNGGFSRVTVASLGEPLDVRFGINYIFH